LQVFAANAGKAAETTPQAFTFQGYSKNRVIYGVVPDYITQAITGDHKRVNAFGMKHA